MNIVAFLEESPIGTPDMHPKPFRLKHFNGCISFSRKGPYEAYVKRGCGVFRRYPRDGLVNRWIASKGKVFDVNPQVPVLFDSPFRRGEHEIIMRSDQFCKAIEI